MAAIVSQLAAANRRRKEVQKVRISNDKSVYYLSPYDQRFEPAKHNAFVRNKVKFEEQDKHQLAPTHYVAKSETLQGATKKLTLLPAKDINISKL